MANTEPALIQPKTKINYIDHLKVVLTVLVIMHHTFITYGAPGGWYYYQKTTLLLALLPMTMFVAVNQAFFMGFFFFLSALFIPSSYDKKGGARFVTDRLIRLGIPVLFYSFILSPFLNYIIYYGAEGHHISYLQFLSGYTPWVSVGVLWFVMALLMFTFLYALYRSISGSEIKTVKIPTIKQILLFAAAIGVITFGVRVIFNGFVLQPFGFQTAHFTQYIAMFILGLIAARSKWLEQADYKMGKRMRKIALYVIFGGFISFVVARRILNFPPEWFSNGFHWQQLWYAVWEQLVGFILVTALLCIGKHSWNNYSPFMSKLSRSSFAVYIFHPLFVISLSVGLSSWAIEPALKLLIVAPLAVVFSFLFGLLLVRIPIVNKVV
jgi:surface polysaccharide O-acyltransferase-like enzyme